MAITTSNQTLGSLEIGTTINYSNCIHAVDTNYKVMNHYADKWGNWTEVLNLETMEFKDLVFDRGKFVGSKISECPDWYIKTVSETFTWLPKHKAQCAKYLQLKGLKLL